MVKFRSYTYCIQIVRIVYKFHIDLNIFNYIQSDK